MAELGVSLILQAVYLIIFVYFGSKIAKWLLNYFRTMSVINKIKGMPMLPFIGNAHQLQLRESKKSINKYFEVFV
jgi:hypothetical protein